ncbi:hypothetical protein FRC18_008297, partial [Serendipita sp. 400]
MASLESVPDPFEVGDDEIDETSLGNDQNSKVLTGTELLAEEIVDSSSESPSSASNQELPGPVGKDSPPGLPPKDTDVSVEVHSDPRRLPVGTDAKPLISPSLFLPIPE